jgi:hypothetical protein
MSLAVLAIITFGVAVSTTVRMRSAAKVPPLFWIAMLIASAIPIAVGTVVLSPKESVSTANLSSIGQSETMKLPEGHSLLVTAELAPLENEDPSSLKTDYALKVKGMGWSQTLVGIVERESEDGGADVDVYEGQGISSGKTRRASGLREDLQERYDLVGNGDILVTVSNLQGSAAHALRVESIPSPPPALLLWPLAIFFSALGIYYETWRNCEKVSGDIAFLAMYAPFLADSVTPLDGYMGVALAAVPAAFLSWGAVAGCAYLASKYRETTR